MQMTRLMPSAVEDGIDAAFFIEDDGEIDSESSDGNDPEQQVRFSGRPGCGRLLLSLTVILISVSSGD